MNRPDPGPASPSAAAARCRIMLVGVGGGGCNSVAHAAGTWTTGPDVLCVNTDAQALAGNWGTHALAIGQQTCHGLGAGGDPAIGKLAAEEDRERIRDALLGVDLAVLAVGMGGGTGTGAAPVVSRVARDEGALTLCFATLPFSFEGEKRMQQARDGLRDLSASADVIVCLPNDHLFEAGEEQSLVEAFARTDRMLAVAVQSLDGVLSRTGVVNLDFADFRQLAEQSGGLCSFGFAEASGAKKSEKVVTALLKSPYLERGQVLAETGACLVNILGGRDLTLAEVRQVMERLQSLTPKHIEFHFGAAVDEAMDGKLAVTVLAAQPRSAAEQFGLTDRPGVPRLAEKTGGTGGQTRLRPLQEKLALDSTDRGRFRGVEPTIYDGQDLDLPTFHRRGVKLSLDK
jgi:cell division protein FtsZ